MRDIGSTQTDTADADRAYYHLQDPTFNRPTAVYTIAVWVAAAAEKN